MTERRLSRFLSDYGMSLVLLLLCIYYSAVTFAEQDPTGAAGGERLARVVIERVPASGGVLLVVRDTREDRAFAEAFHQRLKETGIEVVDDVRGRPSDARAALERIADSGGKLDAIAANQATSSWAVIRNAGARFPKLSDVPVLTPPRYWWPNFLKADNLRNIADQIVIIAILAAGMTFVVITGGIDLSVGSLIALAAVTATLLIRRAAGSETATVGGMVLCCLAAIALCGLVGLFSGSMVTFFQVPSFIVTLSMMLVARGLASEITQGASIYQVPSSFIWLGGGADLLGVPNGVLLMGVLYLAAHVVMTRMTLGRYVYAIGGNAEAARLSGVPVRRVLLLVYALSGALAGLGGVVMASRLKSGAPTYGLMYELYAIAAVVVGGTSLSGGEGKVFGTLIGAFIIAVIKNGMNLTGVTPFRQDVVFGLVILGAILLDRLKKYGGRLRRRSASTEKV
ncbi:MAG TPA: ABC transporter permease [Gemmataceae bacterium]|jgi:ribose transport system permease protein